MPFTRTIIQFGTIYWDRFRSPPMFYVTFTVCHTPRVCAAKTAFHSLTQSLWEWLYHCWLWLCYMFMWILINLYHSCTGTYWLWLCYMFMCVYRILLVKGKYGGHYQILPRTWTGAVHRSGVLIVINNNGSVCTDQSVQNIHVYIHHYLHPPHKHTCTSACNSLTHITTVYM